jgi:hypothetical protein
MTGGSSGGPWFINFNSANGTGSLNSLNSFKYTSGRFTKYMFGPCSARTHYGHIAPQRHRPAATS